MGNKIKEPTKNESRRIKFMILLGIFSILNFLFFFFQPEHRVNSILFVMLSAVILYGVLKNLYMWYNYSNISVPQAPKTPPDFTVDVLTTYFPGEPYEMITNTLKAIKNIRYPHTTYLCDEGNDPYLKKFCQENGIIHVTRDNRKDAKAGNINNALEKYATGDICVILDPDHIPQPDFLDPILPHFTRPEIGFVQVVQSYYNTGESLVAQGASEQTFQFYGPMMMTLNSYGAVNAIGANCVFRRAALDSIGGHAPGLCEDMHTAMLLYAKGWKAVYVPQVLAKGLAPSNLTNFFKQQLKWSRGTFDLWVKVYPKLFKKLTGRQKIHYGILPMHYLSGLIILFTFLIPILSLVFSTTPWKGNIVDFLLVIAPVAASAILIRTYIQKWVIEKKERGFHIIGGLLHINTWWIYLTGLIYTILDRKVPYLPTPKEEGLENNLKIVWPNALVAVLSILAVIYGLYQDLTPFSIIMAGFALFNATIMLFGIYIAVKVTNQNRILRTKLRKNHVRSLSGVKKNFYRIANSTFHATRALALPLLLLILITAMSFKNDNDQSKWSEVTPPVAQVRTENYLGIFQPAEEGGLSAIKDIEKIEAKNDLDFDIISLYLAWTDQSLDQFPHELIKSIYNKGAFPMITWEPWASTLEASDSIPMLQQEQKVFRHITQGHFDPYIRNFARILKSYNQPIFLRFAHEFDNPQYPWSKKGANTPEEFKAAWKHVYHLLKKEGANQVILVWNPWKPEQMTQYYPGDAYVDWVGITLLDYATLPEIQEYSFKELYQPFRDELRSFTRKPVMLAEFGSLQKNKKQAKWFDQAIGDISTRYPEINALVFFNSALDQNFPANTSDRSAPLDWSINAWSFLDGYNPEKKSEQASSPGKPKASKRNPLAGLNMRGVRYRKGTNWKNNYYALTKETLEKDFKAMKQAGINTIQVTGGNIYDHNLLRYSREYELQLIYQFKVNQSLNFIKDKKELQEIRNDILDKVHELKKYKHVKAYSFDMELERYNIKPLLFDQVKAYLGWLQPLVQEVRQIDPDTPLTIELPVNAETSQRLSRINELVAVNNFGLKVADTTHLEEVLEFAKEKPLSVYISSLSLSHFNQNPEKYQKWNVILENWQDQRNSNWMSFDGLVDFRGRKKQELEKISSHWSKAPPPAQNQIRSKILKPAEPLYPGQIYTYHATVYEGASWRMADEDKELHSFEWNLVKNDPYGNPLAVHKVGSGPEIDLIIPENYKNYELLLITKRKGAEYIQSSKTSLHTPTGITDKK